jgi:hypothetical protein
MSATRCWQQQQLRQFTLSVSQQYNRQEYYLSLSKQGFWYHRNVAAKVLSGLDGGGTLGGKEIIVWLFKTWPDASRQITSSLQGRGNVGC